MPFLSIATSLLVVGVFCAGGLAAWFLSERKHERQRAMLERSMTRALEERYHVYQDLERSFHQVFARIDQMEAEWVTRQQPVEPQHTITRIENPELWDLEREFEHRQAEHLTEISEKSRRVVELMKRIEALEPLSQQLGERDREYVQLEETHRVLEETRRARVTELERRIHELEPAANETQAARAQAEASLREVEEWRGRCGAVEEQLDRTRVAIEERAAHVAALEQGVADRDGRIGELQGRVDEIEAEVEAVESKVFMRDELVKEREQQLAEVEAELAHTRTERNRKIEELAALQEQLLSIENSWHSASGEVEQQRSKLAEHLSTFESAQVMLSQLKPLISQLESNLNAEDLHAEGTPEEAPHPDQLGDPFDFVDKAESEKQIVQDSEPEEQPEVEFDASFEAEIDAEAPAATGTDQPTRALPTEPQQHTPEDFDLSILDEEGQV